MAVSDHLTPALCWSVFTAQTGISVPGRQDGTFWNQATNSSGLPQNSFIKLLFPPQCWTVCARKFKLKFWTFLLCWLSLKRIMCSKPTQQQRPRKRRGSVPAGLAGLWAPQATRTSTGPFAALGSVS